MSVSDCRDATWHEKTEIPVRVRCGRVVLGVISLRVSEESCIVLEQFGPFNGVGRQRQGESHRLLPMIDDVLRIVVLYNSTLEHVVLKRLVNNADSICNAYNIRYAASNPLRTV